MKFVIAGNGPAAISAIEAIRKSDRISEIVLISRENEQAYSPCFLYHYLSGEISKDKLYIKERDFYEKNDVIVLYGVSLEKILPDNKSLLLSDGKTISYDSLLIATGAEPLKPDIHGIDNVNIFFFKNLEDTERINTVIKESKRAAVIGGGFIGLEVAEALIKKGLSVIVIEKEKRLLPRMLDQEMSGIVKTHLTKKGIEFITGKRILSIEGKKGQTRGIKLEDGTIIQADLVIISTGVRPNIKSVEGSGIRTERGIIVNERMETNIPGIYAAGDIAEIEIRGIKKINPIWSNATITGDIAGSNMAGLSKRLHDHIPPMNLVNLFGLFVFAAGSPDGIRSVKIEDSSGIRKLLLNEDNVVKGIQIIGSYSIKGGIYLNLLDKTLKEPALLLEKPHSALIN